MEHDGNEPPGPGGVRRDGGARHGGGGSHLPASEAGTGMIEGDETGASADLHLPASEADSGALEGEKSGGEPQSWPGKSFGSIPPPG